MSKNIVIFSDGTGQEGGKKENTNVYKLFNMVEDRTLEQVAFYDRGLGTGWRKISGNVAGMGISKNIQECYEFIFENFQAGDQIYLFGFSRGAATIRSLSGFIDMFGILPKSRPELIKRAWDIYKDKNDERRKEKAADFIERHHTMWTRIRFLGVWDTVAALGLPGKFMDVVLDNLPRFQHKFHNFRLSPSVENACQALAIDDERKIFHPLIWDPDKLDYQTIKQVWFCGVHTDVGGGYEDQGLSDIALEWMIQQAVGFGLKIYPKHKVEIQQNINGEMHDARDSFIKKRLYKKEVRSWNSETHGKPVIHESVLQRKENRDYIERLPYDPWILRQKHNLEEWKQ